jgi:hypothetical protein
MATNTRKEAKSRAIATAFSALAACALFCSALAVLMP